MPDTVIAGNAFHTGERAIQRLAGVDDSWSDAASRSIRHYMPDQHRELFVRLPFLVAGALDAMGQPWATLLEGAPGFIRSPDHHHLHIDTQLPAGDPVAALLRREAKIALLGIEPATRRRNRANGTITATTGQGIEVQVLQSFGNCPKYIQSRTVEYLAGTGVNPAVRRSTSLDPVASRFIRAADTLFIASAFAAAPDDSPMHGVDISHRGGRPGFVHVDGNTLSLHDYVGNNFFNTLGNLACHPLAGLLFIDYADGALLHVAARARIEWLAQSASADRIATNRILHFDVREVVRVTQRSHLHWGEPGLSPFLS